MAGKPTFSPALRNRRWIIAGAVIGTAVAAYGALEVYAGFGIPRNTVVRQVSIGGMTSANAAAVLDNAFSQAGPDAFRVRVADRSFALPEAAQAVRIDVPATLAEIEAHRWNPIALLSMMRGDPVSPVLATDAAALQEAVHSIGQAIAIPAVNAGIDLTPSAPVAIPSRAGLGLDEESATTAILAAAAAGQRGVTLQRATQLPVISTLVAQQALDDVALPAISDSVTVSVTMADGAIRTSVVQAATIRAALSFTPEGALLKPVLDGRVLRRDLDPGILDVQRFAKRAKFRISGESVTVVPSVDGYGIGAESIATGVGSVIRLLGSARSISLRMAPIAANFTTADARALGITELVSSYKQHFPAAAYRTINIGTAARYINGTILKPGETFSMNDTVKERTVENGYTSGWIIGPGGVFKNEMGGAVSTITTAMFNAAWFGGLQFVEHRAHSIYISRYEPGREATVSWGSFDMKFRNNLKHAILITTKLRGTSISVSLWGTKEWPAIGSEFGPWTHQTPYPEIRSSDPECHDQDGEPGFRITVWRTFFNAAGDEVKREPYTTSYRPSPHVICVAANPKPKPTPTPTPTPTSAATDTSTV